MLSYRHGFHAGNFADVFKHAMLFVVLQYLNKKDKPYLVVDTHAGAGEYNLEDEFATKTNEFMGGIDKLLGYEGKDETLLLFKEFVCEIGLKEQQRIYPGSPRIIQSLIRSADFLRLFELHPTDYKKLNNLFVKEKKVQVINENAYTGLKALLPPHTKRGLIFMDPSYELKTEYEDAVHCIINSWKAFQQGIYMLWYPVVNRDKVNRMKKGFEKSSVRNVVQIECLQEKDNPEFGMTGNGFFIINPPWVLQKQAQGFLPELLSILGTADSKWSYKIVNPE